MFSHPCVEEYSTAVDEGKRPTIKGWQRVVLDLVPLEYLTCVLNSKTDQFFNKWNYVEPDVCNIMQQGFKLHITTGTTGIVVRVG